MVTGAVVAVVAVVVGELVLGMVDRVLVGTTMMLAGTLVTAVVAGRGMMGATVAAEVAGVLLIALGSTEVVMEAGAVAGTTTLVEGVLGSAGTTGGDSAAAIVGSTAVLLEADVAVDAGVAVVLASNGSQTPEAMLTNRQTKASMSRGRHHGCRLEIDIVMYNAVTNLSHAVVQPHRGSLEPDRPVPLAEQWLCQLLQVRKCLRIAAHHMRMRNLQCRGDRDHRRPARG